jgi:hypothetical protein
MCDYGFSYDKPRVIPSPGFRISKPGSQQRLKEVRVIP